jgi:large subunit ribosomal protein L10
LAKAAGAMKAKVYQAAYMFTANTAQAARVFDALRQKQESAAA